MFLRLDLHISMQLERDHYPNPPYDNQQMQEDDPPQHH